VIGVTFLRIRLLLPQASAPQAGRGAASSKNPSFLKDKSSAGPSLAPALGASSFETEESPVEGRIPPLSPEDQREFDHWLKANAIVALIIMVGMLAMALAGSNSGGRPDSAMTDSPQSSDIAASK
jgi:hypothetical protein